MKAQADAVGPASPDGAGKILKIHIDGMDQAKFKCPRLTAIGVHKHMLFGTGHGDTTMTTRMRARKMMRKMMVMRRRRRRAAEDEEDEGCDEGKEG